MSSTSTKEIHFSSPHSILSFYKNQPKQGIIYDSSYSKMIDLNKIENDYVIPIDKKPIKPVIPTCNTSIRNIDPNTAIVNQAKENIKNDVIQTKAIVTTNISAPQLKRKSSCQSSPVKEKKAGKQCKRRKTIIAGDIFSSENL